MRDSCMWVSLEQDKRPLEALTTAAVGPVSGEGGWHQLWAAWQQSGCLCLLTAGSQVSSGPWELVCWWPHWSLSVDTRG